MLEDPPILTVKRPTRRPAGSHRVALCVELLCLDRGPQIAGTVRTQGNCTAPLFPPQ